MLTQPPCWFYSLGTRDLPNKRVTRATEEGDASHVRVGYVCEWMCAIYFMFCARCNNTVRGCVVRCSDVHLHRRVLNHSVPLACLQTREISGAEISRRLSGISDLLILIILLFSHTHTHTHTLTHAFHPVVSF